MKSIVRILSIILFLPLCAVAQDDYSFDLAEIEKKPYAAGGYLEVTPRLFYTDPDAAFYTLNFYDRADKDWLDEYFLKLSMDGRYTKGLSEIYARANINTTESDVDSDTNIVLDEGYLSLKPASGFNISLGKKALRWGKGYAWNPVGFVERPKKPDDPELALEGYWVATLDYIKSFSGPLKTVAVTPVILPVYDHVNTDFGERDTVNYAGKLYLLLYDTDIDFMFLKGGSRPFRFGMDFSRNITPNFEIHGELARIDNSVHRVVRSDGTLAASTGDAESFLLGIRYLTRTDTTFILEYYRNETGFTGDEMDQFFGLVQDGIDLYRQSADETLLKRARAVTEGSYGKQNPMRDYLYLRVWQKEPFDIPYFIPSVTCIYNMEDKSFSLSPELFYTGITNLELRLRAGFISGPGNTEFGEKQNDFRLELRMRYYFDVLK
ncbi:MAG: hypothetical protein M0P57_12540 [Syntrophales bacterium]|jgi:hypothetical protein|nr:hypothetical protein [Syntrophales bacterium]MDY0044393.1 hypothetical protein [Syntrophales bacterium]